MAAVAASRPESGSSLIENTRAAVGAMDALLADATRAVRTRVAADGRVSAKLVDREQRAAHGLAWFATYTRVAAPARRLCGADERSRALRRAGRAPRPGRIWRIPRADARRHSDEPGRDGAPGRSWTEARRDFGPRHAGSRGTDRDRQHRGKPRAACRSDARASWRDRRRLRPRRDARGDPRRDAQVRRKRGRAARA